MTIRTSNASQKTSSAATCYPVQRILLFSLIRNDGLGCSERCTHRSCDRVRKGVDAHSNMQEPTEETNCPSRPGEEPGCALGVGPQRILHAADESANQGGLHSDSCSILQRWPCFKARGIRWLIWKVCGRHGEQLANSEDDEGVAAHSSGQRSQAQQYSFSGRSNIKGNSMGYISIKSAPALLAPPTFQLSTNSSSVSTMAQGNQTACAERGTQWIPNPPYHHRYNCLPLTIASSVRWQLSGDHLLVDVFEVPTKMPLQPPTYMQRLHSTEWADE